MINLFVLIGSTLLIFFFIVLIPYFMAQVLRSLISELGTSLKIERYSFVAKLYNFFRSPIVLTLLVYLLIGFTYKCFTDELYKRSFPIEIEISDRVLMSSILGFAEGCSINVYKLTENSKRLFSEKGLESLEYALQSREPQRGIFEKWQETPLWSKKIELEKRWTSGILTCSNLWPSVEKALEEDGSYYTSGKFDYEIGIIILPDLGLAIYSYID